MLDRVLRTQQVAPRDLAIGAVAVAVVQRQEPLLLGFEDSAAVLGPTGSRKSTTIMEPAALTAKLHDRMTEVVLADAEAAEDQSDQHHDAVALHEPQADERDR